MKKCLSILAVGLLLVTGCDYDFSNTATRNIYTKTYEGCEYILISTDIGHNGWEHKGNCTNCRAWMTSLVSNQMDNCIKFTPYPVTPLPFYIDPPMNLTNWYILTNWSISTQYVECAE